MSKGIFLRTKFSENAEQRNRSSNRTLAKSGCYPGQAYVTIGRSLQSTVSDNDVVQRNSTVHLSEEFGSLPSNPTTNFKQASNYPAPLACADINDHEPEPPIQTALGLNSKKPLMIVRQQHNKRSNSLFKSNSGKFEDKSHTPMGIVENNSPGNGIVDIKKLGFDLAKVRNFMELAELRSINQTRKKKKEELLNNPASSSEVIMPLEKYLAELAPPSTGHLIQTPAKPILQKKPFSRYVPPSSTGQLSPTSRPRMTPKSAKHITFNSENRSKEKRKVGFTPNNIILLYQENPLEKEALSQATPKNISSEQPSDDKSRSEDRSL